MSSSGLANLVRASDPNKLLFFSLVDISILIAGLINIFPPIHPTDRNRDCQESALKRINFINRSSPPSPVFIKPKIIYKRRVPH